MTTQVPQAELTGRLDRFRSRMNLHQPNWELAAIFGRVNQYYFTGTMQDGLLLVPRDGAATFWVRRSFERARSESLLADIRPMNGFRDAAAQTGIRGSVIHVETEVVTVAVLQRFRKYFPCREILSLDTELAWVRATKSPYELDLVARSGAVHRRVMEDGVPRLLREGMSEAELGCELFSLLVREGHQGLVRFAMPGAEIVVGQIGFGENSLHPTSFSGAGGCCGLSPAAPVLGSRSRHLGTGDLVYADIGCGIDGYQTDKTLVYSYGRPQPEPVVHAHRRCFELEQRIASRLKPGAIPSEIYATVMRELEPEFLENFMGYGDRRVRFVGHGVGLLIDELPVIAEGFDEPLSEGMVLAIEPKKGIPGVGMVGSENTYLVTPEGGRSLTGQSPGLGVVEYRARAWV
jgi:Xaa-Pro dipeptidase